MSEPILMSAQDAAASLGMSINQFRTFAKEAGIPFFHLGIKPRPSERAKRLYRPEDLRAASEKLAKIQPESPTAFAAQLARTV